MQPQPLRTTVIGSYPFPGWLHFASDHLDRFGRHDIAELQRDAVLVAMQDQLSSGLDVITDGEQTRLDFNLSFYGFLEGIELESESPRQFGPPAHDQRGKHRIVGELRAPRGLGAVEDYRRMTDLAANMQVRDSVVFKASVPGPYTMAGRLETNNRYPDRYAIAESLMPIIRDELIQLVESGCRDLTVDEPSMSCYAYREDRPRLVDLFNRTIEPIAGRCRLATHLCFGNFKGHPVGLRRYGPMFPDFLELHVDEIHVEMANREFSEIEIIKQIGRRTDVSVGIIDVKSYYIESIADVVQRCRLCLEHVPPERLSIAPDCGLSQTARWAAIQKLTNMVAGVHEVRRELGLD